MINRAPIIEPSDFETLVWMVHCRHHRATDRYSRTARLVEWLESWLSSDFSSGNNRTRLDKKLRQWKTKLLFGQLSKKCIGYAYSKGRFCKYKVEGIKVENSTERIDNISTDSEHLNDADLGQSLHCIEENMHCRHHTDQSSSSSDRVESWRAKIREICPYRKSSPCQSTGSSNNLASRSCNRHDRPPFEIVEESDMSEDACEEEVQRLMEKPLERKEYQEGYIYAYTFKGAENMVKIGYTTKHPRRRLEEWESDCNRQPKQLFPVPHTQAVKVPNARRVEDLCHKALGHRNVIVYCTPCLGEHEEWFRVSPKEAIEVIEGMKKLWVSRVS